jgi:hypothetical protein
MFKNNRPAKSKGWKVTNEPAILLFIVPGLQARRKGRGSGGQFFRWSAEAYSMSAPERKTGHPARVFSGPVNGQNVVSAESVGAMPCHAGLGARQ